MAEPTQSPKPAPAAAIDPASFPLGFEPWTYRALHSDLWYMPDEQLLEHYQSRGRSEGRRAHPLAFREQFRDLALPASSILEIGPFFKPLFTGPNVACFDVLDRPGLLARARELGYDDVTVPEIDYVSPTGDLSIVNQTFDVVASSHAIEHQPNLIRHLRQVEALLRPGGYYFLFIPDKRYCFDHFMPESTVAEVVAADVEHRQFHSLQTVIRQQVLVTHNEPVRHWHGDHGQPDHFNAGSVQTALRVYQEAREAGTYIDRHAWQFTPESFREIVQMLSELGMIRFRPLRVYDTLAGSHEFWAILHMPPQDDGPDEVRRIVAAIQEAHGGQPDTAPVVQPNVVDTTVSVIDAAQLHPERMEPSPPLDVELSSVDLDPRVSPIRHPTRPVFARDMMFEGYFDFFTLFYDIFEESQATSILAVGPPFPCGMDPARDIEFVSTSSGQACQATYIRPQTRWGPGFFRMTLQSDTRGIAIRVGGQEVIRPVQPNLSRLFSDRRVLIAKNKDNPLEWIVDWARYHVVNFGVDALLLYDNASRNYDAADLRQALSLVPGLEVAVVVAWPFPYVLPGVGLWPTADGRWSDCGFLEIGRRRFLSNAAFALHLDVDELLVRRSELSLEDLIAAHYVAWFQIGSQNIMTYPPLGDTLPRHKDFFWTRPTSMVRPKYLVVPRRCPEEARWWVHIVQDASFVSVDPTQFSVAHFLPLTTGWSGKAKRRASTPLDEEKHVADTVLRNHMDAAFRDWDPEVQVWDPLQTSDPDLLRVAALEAYDRGERNRAITLLTQAITLDPYHPGQQMLRQKFLADGQAVIQRPEQDRR